MRDWILKDRELISAGLDLRSGVQHREIEGSGEWWGEGMETVLCLVLEVVEESGAYGVGEESPIR